MRTFDLAGYSVIAKDGNSVLMATDHSESAVVIRFDKILLSSEEHKVDFKGERSHKIFKTDYRWAVRWADSHKGGWNNFGTIRTKYLMQAVRRICKMHAGGHNE